MCPTLTHAQDVVSLSVSPTLFDMSASPGQDWTSTIRVINANPFDMTVYSSVVNLEADGERGKSKLVPLFEDNTAGDTLGDWISVSLDEVTIPAEKTVQIPFTITVPDEAAPGGYFAAIMIGTKSLGDSDQNATLETSQVVTALIFLRVTGDVTEIGSIRSFRTTKRLLEQPKATFELRFENAGNVHLQPQGEIKIFNMWGQARGIIPINKKTLFGNVLPDSIRAYSFDWEGEWSIADIGRYTAEATLAYGVTGRQSAFSQTSFWIIPWKIVTTVLVVLVLFGVLFTWSLKLYIRRMLAMSGVQQDHTALYGSTSRKNVSVIAPIEAGILDLRERFNTTKSWRDRPQTFFEFVKQYKTFFVTALGVLLFIFLVVLYVKTAIVKERDYTVTVDVDGKDITISSLEVKPHNDSETQSETEVTSLIKNDFPPITVVNQSGIIQLGDELRYRLERKGYQITGVQDDFGAVRENTVIVYNPDYADQALELSKDIPGSLLSAFVTIDDNDTPLTVYIGNDF